MHGNTYFFKNNKLKKINKEIAKKLQRTYKEITKKLQKKSVYSCDLSEDRRWSVFLEENNPNNYINYKNN